MSDLPAEPSLPEVESPAFARPLVAIVGRPNVGKSALFNRLMGERTAIIEGAPGTTRDRLYGDVDWGDRSITLVDTAGLDPEPEGELAQRVQEQARMALAEADVLLFMVDCETGTTAADAEVADLLRRSDQPVILVANKADNPRREMDAAEFFALGLGPPVAISAYHGTGIGDLMDRVLEALPPPQPTPAVEAGVRVAVVGRPNVGKSMLINAILGQERVLVSSVPGTTRDAVDTSFAYQGAPMTLIDTAGIRRSGQITPGVERYSVMRALRAIGRADVAVLVIDAAEGVTAQDTHVAGYVAEAFRGLVIAVNKWDLAQDLGLDREQVVATVASRLKFFPDAPVLAVSARLKQGIGRLLQAINRVQAERQKRVPTAEVNALVRRAVQEHPPPPRPRPLKVLYATQAATAPPTFVFFVNDRSLMHFSYQRYLENRLRSAFGFQGTPIRSIFRSRGES